MSTVEFSATRGVILRCWKCKIQLVLGPHLRSVTNLLGHLSAFDGQHPDTVSNQSWRHSQAKRLHFDGRPGPAFEPIPPEAFPNRELVAK